MTICPARHRSDEPDYCSVCGLPLRVGGAAEPARVEVPDRKPERVVDVSRPLVCPLCGEPRGLPPTDACAVCCYPFAPPEVARWRLEVVVDPGLDDEPDPSAPCPPAGPVATVEVTGDEVTVGRHDAVPRPGVALRDPGASRRHARFVREGDELRVADVGSTNGTRHNGVELRADEPVVVRDGDQVTIGRWTRITVRERTP